MPRVSICLWSTRRLGLRLHIDARMGQAEYLPLYGANPSVDRMSPING